MLGTSYEAAWFLFHRLREAANDMGGSDPIGGPNKVVEADESYIGGKARNKAFGPPPKKMALFTLVEREGEARSRHVADVTARSLREAIVTQASRDSYLMTDEALVYERLGREFAGHGTVNHSVRSTSALAAFITPMSSNRSSRCSSVPFMVNSTVSARRIFIAISPRPISNTTIASRSGLTIQNVLRYCAAQRASGFSIDSLTSKPKKLEPT
jgi:hypothetical protein